MGDRWIQGLENLPTAVRGCVLTIGNFDGVHLGHQAILSAAREQAKRAGTGVVAMTFDPPPDLVLRPGDESRVLTPAALKAELLLESGADWVVTARSTPQLLLAPPDQFLEEVVGRLFAPAAMVEGHDFFFGKGRSGTVELLARFGQERGFPVHVSPDVQLRVAGVGQRVSSTLIRRLVAAGEVESARGCLGRPFTLVGTIVTGFGRGRTLEFPTANLDPGSQVAPGDGVYACRARIAGADYAAAVSIGTQPTFPSGKHAVEAFLLDAGGDFYGQDMSLAFVARLRGQQKFDSVEALKRQVDEDVRHVRQRIERDI